MPYFYDLARATTTNGSANTLSPHMWGVTVANQETVGIYGLYASARSNTAGGATLRGYTNSGSIATSGTAQTPQPKNLRGSVAAQSTWKNDATTINPGGTLTERIIAGFAQTGGQGGYVPIVPTGAVQMMPNGTNPVDFEVDSIAATASIGFDMLLEIGEGI